MASRTKGVVVSISAEENTGRAFSAVNEQIAGLKAQVSSLRSQLAAAGTGFNEMAEGGQRFASGMYAQMTYASSAVREFEGTLPIRAVERFLTETLGLGHMLGSIFPVVGAIAFGSIIIRDIADLVRMQEAATKLASLIKAAFDEAIAKERQHADELAVSNDRLDDQIAKLEHKPSNGLAAGADEARVEVDKLTGSIHSAAEEAEKLFDDKYKVSMFARVVDGTKSTSGVKDEVAGAMAQADDLQNQYAVVAQQAADSGESKETIDKDITQNMLGRVQGVYSALDKKLNDQLKDALNKQYDDKQLGGTGATYQPLINSLQGALGLSQQQQRSLGEQYRQSQLTPVTSQDHGDITPKTPKTKDDAQKMIEAQNSFQEAIRKQQAQAAEGLAEVEKLASQAQLAALDQKHKEQLVSDEDYYKQRADLQKAALEQEQAANYKKQGGLRDEITSRITGLSKDSDPSKRVEDEAKIVELQTQLASLEDERLGIAQQISKVETEGATETYEALKKSADEALQIAARLEGLTGGSTNARVQSSRSKYDEWMKANPNASPDQVMDRQRLQGIDEAQIQAQGAEQDAQPALASVNAQRSATSYGVQAGTVNSAQAQQQRIEADKAEAEALQPVLEAYEQLAALGDESAKSKVAELSMQIAELKNPVSEVATEIRTQLNGALEQLFENLGKGKNAWKDFAKSLQSMALKDTYQQFLQPLVQTALGHAIPNGGNPGSVARAAAPGGNASLGKSLLGSIMPGVAAKLPGVGGAKGGGGVTVQIINQTSSPAQGTASQQQTQDGSAMTEMLRPQVIQIMLEDLDRGGSFAQALSGLGGLAAG